MGAADHRAVPERPPGGRLGRLPTGSQPAGRRARSRPGTATATARAPDPRATTRRSTPPDRRRSRRRPHAGTCRRCRPTSSVATAWSPTWPSCSPRRRLVEIVGPGGVGKTAVAIATGRTLRPAGGVWLARLEMATDARRRRRHLIAALNVTGGETALVERLRRTRHRPHPGQLRARHRRRRRSRRRASSTPRRGCGSCAPARCRSAIDGEAVLELAPLPLADAVELFTRRATRAARPSGPRSRRGGGARPVPGARRAAAGDRARRGADEDAVGRGHHPPPRRPLRRAARPDEPQAGATPGARRDDPLELRPVVPRRPAWPVGARHVPRRRPAGRRRVRARRARRAGPGGDRRRRPARQPLPRHRRRRQTSTGRRYRLLDSIRAFAVDAMSDAGLTHTALAAHARWYADAAASSTERRAQQPASRPPRVRPDRAGQHRRRADVVGRPRPDCWRWTSSTGSAGPGSCSVTAGARSA